MTQNDQTAFDDAFRRWAARPPATTEAAAVCTAVGSVQRPRSSLARPSPAWTALGVAALVLVAGTASFIRSLAPMSSLPATTTGTTPAAVPARNADVVLWLDDETPVYVFLPDGD